MLHYPSIFTCRHHKTRVRNKSGNTECCKIAQSWDFPPHTSYAGCAEALNAPRGISVFLPTLPCTGCCKQDAEALVDEQGLQSSWLALLQPLGPGTWVTEETLSWHFFQHLSFPANAANWLRWPSAGSLWMEVISWLNRTRLGGSLNRLLQSTVLFLGLLHCWRDKLPKPRNKEHQRF